MLSFVRSNTQVKRETIAQLIVPYQFNVWHFHNLSFLRPPGTTTNNQVLPLSRCSLPKAPKTEVQLIKKFNEKFRLIVIA